MITHPTISIVSTRPPTYAELETATAVLARRVAELERINDVQNRQLERFREAAAQQAGRIADTFNGIGD